jgi:prenylcysteine alpha-carboxyl methylesterase
MVEDVNTGIAWVLRKAQRYGGDPDSVFLCGQSAGGQLAALALLKQAEQAASGQAVQGAAPVWHPLDIKGFIGVSGAYELEGLAEHLHRRGLYKSLLASIMSVDGQVAYAALSPVHVARSAAPGLAAFLPPALLVHGDADRWAQRRGVWPP